MSGIPVEILFPDIVWSDVKIHVAQKAGKWQPIDVFTRDFEEWKDVWNGAYHSNHCWNREFIFSMIEMPKAPNRWLFGGIFRVLSHKPKKNPKGKDCIYYEVEVRTKLTPC